MNAYRSRPLAFPWPPVFYAIAIIVAFGLAKVITPPPIPMGDGTRLAVGAGLVVLALTMDLWALLTLRRGMTTVMPHRSSNHLVTGGPYRLTRNPIYLGYTLMTAGIGFLSGNAWLLAAAALAAVLTHIVAIRAEELHLIARFGIDFERYCRRTRRWI